MRVASRVERLEHGEQDQFTAALDRGISALTAEQITALATAVEADLAGDTITTEQEQAADLAFERLVMAMAG